ncbi:hypothetical protein V8D89_012500 [Ganoderma adspersum]
MSVTASDSPRAGPVVDFHSLPEDIVLRILLLCDIEALFACKRVSRSLQHLIDADIYLQYKIELALNGMVDGPASCKMNFVEKLQLLKDYSVQYHSANFTNSHFKHSWQRWPEDVTMPKTDWEPLLGFGGSISYIVIKPPQKQISICAPPSFAGPREMEDWVVPYETLSGRPELVVVSVSVDLSQDLLLVAVQGEDTRNLSILLRSLDTPKEAHLRALQSTLAITMPDKLESAGNNTPNPPRLDVGSIQIHRNIVAWKLSNRSRPLSPCAIEVWDWRIGQRLWRSHYAYGTSFTLLDDAYIVTAGSTSEVLVVERFVQRAGEAETSQVFALGLPPRRGAGRVQESCIPSPRSPAGPFSTDPALRMVVVKLAEESESALLIPYMTFLDQISASQAKQHAQPKRKELPHIAWKDWRAQAILLVPIGQPPSFMAQGSFEHCHSYGSRVVVNTIKGFIVMLDLNPWAARFARRFPKPALPSGEDRSRKRLFSTKDVTLPHGAVLREWYYGMGFAQSTPGLATDPMGFTEVYSMKMRSPRFLGSISHYI